MKYHSSGTNVIHDRNAYIEIIQSEMRHDEDFDAVSITLSAVCKTYRDANKCILLLVNLSNVTSFDPTIYREVIGLLEPTGCTAVALLIESRSQFETLTDSTIESFGPVFPIEKFTVRNEALDWLASKG